MSEYRSDPRWIAARETYIDEYPGVHFDVALQLRIDAAKAMQIVERQYV